jgi:predicted component of type VI protein secretion system
MKLVIEDEAGTRSVVPFTDDAVVVGRAAEGVTFRLADRNVSRRHARFVRQNGAVFVEDLGSLLGTRLNGERISGRRRVRDGDLVQIGDYDLALLAEGATLEPGAPPPLPAAARVEPTAPGAALDPTPSASAAPAPPLRQVQGERVAGSAPRRAGGARVLARALLVGVLALGVGVAAGWAAGVLTPP